MAAGHVVADGVIDQVRHQPLDEPGVAVEAGGAELGLDVQSGGACARAGARQNLAAGLRQVDAFAVAEPALTAGLGSFASLRSVSIILPQRVIIHTMFSSASSSIAAMRDAEIYAVLKGLEDPEAKQRRDLRRLLDAYPDVVFSCGMQVVCHESKAYSGDPKYDSLRLVSHYAII